MSDFRTYITQTGFGLERDAKFNNVHVPFATLVVGDGKLADESSPANQTDLIHQVKDYPVTIEKDDLDSTVWIARAEIPASEGGFAIFEAGVKTSDGHLYCYARQPGDYKPLLSEGQGKSYTIRLKFIPSNTDTIEIKIDPSVQFATPTDLSNVENSLRSSLDLVIGAGGLSPDPEDEAQLAQSISKQIRSRNLFDVSGTADAVILTTKSNKQSVKSLSDLDEFLFVVSATNTGAVTLKIDGLGPIAISNIVSANQLFETALATVMYKDNAFYLIDQINPKTGNSVLDICKLYTDTVDISRAGEYVLDGSSINSKDHPIACAIAAISSNYVPQLQKTQNPIGYAGFYGWQLEEDGSITVTLPAVGGEFIRMYDSGRGITPGTVFGGYASQSIQSHDHDVSAFFVGNTAAFQVTDQSSDSIAGTDLANPSYGYLDNKKTALMGDAETKPRSLSFIGKTRL